MKKLKLLLSAAAAMLILPGTAQAVAAAQWGTALTIWKIDMEDGGVGNPVNIYVTFNGTPVSAGCSGSSSGWWKLGAGSTDANTKILNAIMAAKLAGRTVAPYFNGSCDGNGYPVFVHAQIF